jgi:hypothetical protein
MLVVREIVGSTGRLLHLESPGEASLLFFEHPGHLTITIAGREHAVVAGLWNSVRRPVLANMRLHDFTMCTLWTGEGGAQPHRADRQRWSEVRHNYPRGTARELDRLMALTEPDRESGRLLLWHGPAGTGKTSATLALMTEWRPWADIHVASDPERLFQDPNYLLQVARDHSSLDFHKAFPQHDEPLPTRWKLVVCEDADEYLRADAKQQSGPGLGRLLNLTDGILGAHTRVIVLLTTNDETERLHPAIRRPGRCLAEVSFPAFSRTEACAWLPEGLSAPSGPTTLAQLFARRDGRHITESEPDRIGNYV